MMTAPAPAAHRVRRRVHPTGTEHTKGMALLMPKLAAKAVDKVVLGPGVKLVAVASVSKAPSSVAVMVVGCTVLPSGVLAERFPAFQGFHQGRFDFRMACGQQGGALHICSVD